ncbi:MAG: hypothetical protein CME84_14925 [Henriciella sp.]|nr:hypothetical protein [Henriciella sp.]
MKNSPLFDALDPTEKGGINFYLGMISAKLCADIVLDIDWLIHLSWMKENHALTLLAGKSAPDMLGKKADGTWSVFEAKGRNGGLLEADARKAKDQSNKAIAVDGTLCDLHVGGVLFRDPSSGRHCYHWRDPKPDDDRQYYLETNRNTWIQYYALPYFLHQIAEEDPDRFLTENGFMVRLTDDAYDFASKLIETNQDYSNELGNLMQSAGARRRSGVVLKGANADGTIIKLRDDQ